MIESFKHNRLKNLFENTDASGIRPNLLKQVKAMLVSLDAAGELYELTLPGVQLHRLKGNTEGFYVISTSNHWGIVFRFENGSAFELELIDYH